MCFTYTLFDVFSNLFISVEQMTKLYCSMRWPYDYSTSINTIDEETYERKLRELELERDQVFVNAPSKASLWKLLPSTKDLRNQIQV